jgi:glycosyltransferase involved in cell wall biosynthesis
VATHATKTAWSLVGMVPAAFWPAPSLLGPLRVPAELVERAAGSDRPVADGPVVLVLPARNEQGRVGGVIARLPAEVAGRATVCLVVDDGSVDGTLEEARAAGAVVVREEVGRGLGAAVRTGVRSALDAGASVVAFCDADGEYDPAELERLVAPIVGGRADYVVGSRFAGRIDRMLPHRRLGNVVLTRWVRWMCRLPVTDGQSGFRALSARAASEARIVHDYNYAQVLTVELRQLGFRYAEVPISYRFRDGGRSFVKLGRYLRRVVPATLRLLAEPPKRASVAERDQASRLSAR